MQCTIGDWAYAGLACSTPGHVGNESPCVPYHARTTINKHAPSDWAYYEGRPNSNGGHRSPVSKVNDGYWVTYWVTNWVTYWDTKIHIWGQTGLQTGYTGYIMRYT